MLWCLNGWSSIPTERLDHRGIFDDLDLIARESGEGEAYRDLLPDSPGAALLARSEFVRKELPKRPIIRNTVLYN